MPPVVPWPFLSRPPRSFVSCYQSGSCLALLLSASGALTVVVVHVLHSSRTSCSSGSDLPVESNTCVFIEKWVALCASSGTGKLAFGEIMNKSVLDALDASTSGLGTGGVVTIVS